MYILHTYSRWFQRVLDVCYPEFWGNDDVEHRILRWYHRNNRMTSHVSVHIWIPSINLRFFTGIQREIQVRSNGFLQVGYVLKNTYFAEWLIFSNFIEDRNSYPK